MKKVRCAFFPFTEQVLPILRHFNANSPKYEICEAITWSGIGVNGKDISFICNQTESGIIAENFETSKPSKWDTLIVDLDMAQNPDSHVNLISWFKECLFADKALVLISAQINPMSSIDGMNELYNNYQSKIEFIFSDKFFSPSLMASNQGFRPLSIPVILVGGLVKESSTLEIIFSLRKVLQKGNHSVACLCSSTAGILVGMHSYSHILISDRRYSEVEKIKHINRLAHDIIQAERPEVLLVEAPDALLKYNYIAPNGFGILTYIVSQALEPDFSVCCMPVDVISPDFVSAITQEILHRYGCKTIGIHVSNYVIDSAGVRRDQTATPVFVNLLSAHRAVYQAKSKRNITIPVFNVHTEGVCDLYRHLLEERIIFME